MEKKIDAVKLMREIRTKLAEKYLKSRGFARNAFRALPPDAIPLSEMHADL